VTPAAPTGWAAVAFGFVNNLPTYVAVANTVNPTGAVMVSNTGFTWTAANLPSAPGGACVGVAYGNGEFVAVFATASTTAGIAYSRDGLSWTFATTTAPAGNWSVSLLVASLATLSS